MKAYTDLEQSCKLAGILPLESVDMYYTPPLVKGHTAYIPHLKRRLPIDWDIEQAIPCWSLAALLKTLNFPSLTQNKEDEWEVCVFDHDNDDYIKKTASNPVDACYEMIMTVERKN